HQGAMGRLLERIEREQPQRALDRRFRRPGCALMREESGQGSDGHLVQALSLAEEPVLERSLLDGEAIQEVASIEGGRVGERRRSALGYQSLELDDVHRYGADLERHQVAIGIERVVLG